MSIFTPIFEALDRSGARYVTVGGFAVVLHGHARLTADIDLVVDLDPGPARAVIGVLTGLGFRPRAPVRAEAFADPDVRRAWVEEKNLRVFSLYDPENPLLSIDLFAEYPMPFEELFERSRVVPVGGVGVRVASLPDLIAMKRAAGRPEDLQDVEALEEIARQRGED